MAPATVQLRGNDASTHALSVDDQIRLRVARTMLLAVVGVFVLVLIRSAWLCDDAYINFRTIDNFLNGYGLRWNVAERVQSFTDPLWVFVISAGAAITKEFYFTTIGLSLALSTMAVVVYALAVAGDEWTAILGVVLLLGSKAFVDYSTSGLENPLTHLLIVAFLALYGSTPVVDAGRVGRLALIATLCALTRMDTVLLLAPALLAAVFAVGPRRSLGPLLVGAAPLVAWELFSIVYYGQPLPNTAYAKLGGGIPQFERTEQGLYYLLDSINRDPLTMTIVMAALFAPFATRRMRDRPVVLGILLSLVYVVAIGGDFMSGRFLAAPFLCSVVVLTRVPWRAPQYLWAFPVSIILVAAGSSQAPPLSTDRTFHHDFQDRSATVDERRVYYQYTGLLNAGSSGPLQHPWARHAGEVIAAGDKATVWGATGFFGFAAGRQLHVIDDLALGDVLLARLPAGPDWRPGHLKRRVPEGYLDTILTGRNRIVEPGLAALYEHVQLITRGPLFSGKRFESIWGLNTGAYNKLIDDTSYGTQRLNLPDVVAAIPEGGSAHLPGVRQLREGGIEVRLDRIVTGGKIEISLDANDDYVIVYGNDGRDLCHQLVRARWPHTDGSRGLAVHLIEPRSCASAFDRIRVYGRDGVGRYFLGHVRLVP